MKSILKLVWKNIRHGKGSFLGIIILMAIITFSFSGTVSNNDALHSAIVSNFEEAGVGDLIVYIHDDILSDEIIESIDRNKNVESYTIHENIVIRGSVMSDGKEVGMAPELTAFRDGIKVFNDKGNGYISDPSLEDGEIYLPYKVKILKGLKTGDELSIKTRNGWDEKFIVKGFYEDPVLGSLSMNDTEYVITASDFERIRTEKTDHIYDEPRYLIQMDRLFIHGAGGISSVDLKHALAADTDLINSSSWTVEKENLIDTFEIYSKVGTRCVFAFTLILFAIILITMCNSISSSIEMEYTELGILKSQGFTSGMIRGIYVIQYVLALIIGAVLGIAISVPACMILIRLWMNITCILTGTGVSFLKCSVLCLLIIIICVLFIIAVTGKIGDLSPVRAISGEKSDVHFDSRLNTRIKKRPLSFFIALRQLNSRRRNYIGTTLIVALMVFFLVCIIQMVRSFDPDKMYVEQKCDILLSNLGGFTFDISDEVEEAVKDADPGASVHSTAMKRITVDGDLFSLYTFLNNDDNYDLLDGRQPKYDNEILVTKNVSENIGKVIGDSVIAAYKGKKSEYIITGYYQAVNDFGLAVSMTREGMEKLVEDTSVYTSYVELSDLSKRDEILAMLNERFANKLAAKEYLQSESDTKYRELISTIMNALIYAMYIIIMIFSAVVVSMACRRAFIRERTDIGIFKSQGFTSGNLRMQFAFRFTLTALIGSAIGCLLSILWSEPLIRYIIKIVGISEISMDLSVMSYLGPAAALCVCFFVFSYITSRCIRNVEIRELITE